MNQAASGRFLPGRNRLAMSTQKPGHWTIEDPAAIPSAQDMAFASVFATLETLALAFLAQKPETMDASALASAIQNAETAKLIQFAS